MVTKDDLAKLKVIGHDGKEQPLVLRDCQVAFLNKLLEAKKPVIQLHYKGRP